MKKRCGWMAGIVGATVLLAATPALSDPPVGIHVTGRGTLEVEPDMGYVQLHVRRDGVDAGKLASELDGVVGEVLALTRRLGIAERDVTATALSIYPRYEHRDDQTVVTGLTASRSIEVTLRELDRFGDLMSEALELGINNLDPLRPDTSRRGELEEEGLNRAMEDAKREAARVATGFGVELGPVNDVQVQVHSPVPGVEMRARMLAADSGGGAFSPGIITIERFLTATFSIIPGQ